MRKSPSIRWSSTPTRGKKGDLRMIQGSTKNNPNLKHDDRDLETTYEKIDYGRYPDPTWCGRTRRAARPAWGDGFDIGMTIRDPQIEFVLAQHPWLENDCIYADIVLPTNTYLEVDDVMPCVRDGEHFQTMLNMRQAIPPVGESKSDL